LRPGEGKEGGKGIKANRGSRGLSVEGGSTQREKRQENIVKATAGSVGDKGESLPAQSSLLPTAPANLVGNQIQDRVGMDENSIGKKTKRRRGGRGPSSW